LIEGTLNGFALDPDSDVVIPLLPEGRYLINVGSIGQPRDGDPRAGYGVLDDEALVVSTFRVPYPVEKAQRRILAAGLPASLANRLALGR
jgi:diadenosine tetraphosphatase ApaH/serine/threonine PP2A family protein phosphatase